MTEIVLNRLVGTIHVRKGHSSSNLKKVREGGRQITPGASLLADGIAVHRHQIVLFCFSENTKRAAMARVEQAKRIVMERAT